jgi:hypothetical protein
MQDTHRAHTCSPHVWSDNSTLLTASALDSSRARGVDAVICHQSTPTHHIKRLHSDILSLSLSRALSLSSPTVKASSLPTCYPARPHPRTMHPRRLLLPFSRTPAPCTAPSPRRGSDVKDSSLARKAWHHLPQKYILPPTLPT